MNISLGTKIIGNFGADVELAEGVVVGETLSSTLLRTEFFLRIKWSNGSDTWVMKKSINEVGKLAGAGYYTKNRVAGYYTKEVYYS